MTIRFVPLPEKSWAGEHSEFPCMHPDHDPPMHIVVPSGMMMVHTCPSCGQVAYVTPAPSTMIVESARMTS